VSHQSRAGLVQRHVVDCFEDLHRHDHALHAVTIDGFYL
jgi:hypothetical protein